jgi:hypothetical protein
LLNRALDTEPVEHLGYEKGDPAGRGSHGPFGTARRMTCAEVSGTHTTEPLLVVEVDADICFEQQRWRHATTYRRVRGDLEPADLAKTLPGQRLTRDRSARVLPADQMADLDG